MCRFRSKDLAGTYCVWAHHGPTEHFCAYAMNVGNFVVLTETGCVCKSSVGVVCTAIKFLGEKKAI